MQEENFASKLNIRSEAAVAGMVADARVDAVWMARKIRSRCEAEADRGQRYAETIFSGSELTRKGTWGADNVQYLIAEIGKELEADGLKAVNVYFTPADHENGCPWQGRLVAEVSW
jgi:hypothetical protein